MWLNPRSNATLMWDPPILLSPENQWMDFFKYFSSNYWREISKNNSILPLAKGDFGKKSFLSSMKGDFEVRISISPCYWVEKILDIPGFSFSKYLNLELLLNWYDGDFGTVGSKLIKNRGLRTRLNRNGILFRFQILI